MIERDFWRPLTPSAPSRLRTPPIHVLSIALEPNYYTCYLLAGEQNEQRATGGVYKSGGGGDEIFRFCGGGVVGRFLTVASATTEVPQRITPQ